MNKNAFIRLVLLCVSIAALACTTEFSREDGEDGDTDAVDDGSDGGAEADGAPDLPDGTDVPDVSDGEEQEIGPDCGNGSLDDGEECDDGNGVDGDGCDRDCTYSCSEDADCRDDEPCNGDETCNTDDHVCEEGQPREDGFVVTEDPVRTICLEGTSVESRCGDGYVDEGGGEFCEPPGEGICNATCGYDCSGDGDCDDDGNMCNGEEYCDLSMHACDRRDAPEDGIECGTAPRRICIAETCQESRCGDLFTDAGADEECDDGMNGNPLDGCTDACRFTCHTDEDCSDGQLCNGVETCTLETEHGRACEPGSNEPGTTMCDDGMFCTLNDHCDGMGGCTGDPNLCGDGLSCTNDLCNETSNSCEYTIVGGTCLISNQCYGNGTQNPTNVCQYCNSTASNTSWTNRPSTYDCASDSLGCTEDKCNGAGSCVHTLMDGYCLISNACYEDGARRPSYECQECDVSTSTSTWTNVESGTLCTQDAFFCNGQEACSNGLCVSPDNPCATGSTCWEDEDRCCVDHEAQQCDSTQRGIYWFDSCGHRQELVEDCHNNPPAQNGICQAGPPPQCVCRTHWTGALCDVCPGNWDPDADCDACEGNYDPANNCETCLPGWFGPTCDACRVYVDAAVSGGDGRSWTTAFASVQVGLDSAMDLGCAEVWVKQGTYAPTSSIQLRRNVALYGGFNGTEELLSQRNWRTYVTTLDGNRSVGPVVHCMATQGCNNGSVIDGFTIVNGMTSGFGGGMAVEDASPLIANCTFRNNTSNAGGALELANSSAVVIGCKFGNNRSTNNGGGVSIYGNSSGWTTPYFENCLFWGNGADNRGGGLYVDVYTHPLLMNCTFSDNHANDGHDAGSLHGGGIMLWAGAYAEVTVINSILYYNTVWESGSIVYSQIGCFSAGDCIKVHVKNSDIHGGFSSFDDQGGNLSVVPRFIDRPSYNYDLDPAYPSPCIDMGTDTGAPAADIDGVTRYDFTGQGNAGVITDMGCYEG